jgi:hypothetical protein
MKTIKIFVLLSFFLGFISCDKDNVEKPDEYKTIVPLDYFPAFPGSYWVYDNGKTLKVADQYEKYIFNSAHYSASPKYDTLLLPKLILNGFFNSNDSFAYVNEYAITKANISSYKDPAFKCILSEFEDSIFEIGGRDQIHKIVGKTIKKDTSIIINSRKYENVLITIELDLSCNEQGGYPVDSCAYKREFYAKGIGLIKRESGSYIPVNKWTTDFELKEYHIEK